MDVKEALIAEIKSFQEWAAGDDGPVLPWFATLNLESAAIEGDKIAFVFRDPAEDARHGWRWEILPRERWELFRAHLHEDLETTETLTEPDENGVRWWGVNLYT